jgi:hypothetical protein
MPNSTNSTNGTNDANHMDENNPLSQNVDPYKTPTKEPRDPPSVPPNAPLRPQNSARLARVPLARTLFG